MKLHLGLSSRSFDRVGTIPSEGANPPQARVYLGRRTHARTEGGQDVCDFASVNQLHDAETWTSGITSGVTR